MSKGKEKVAPSDKRMTNACQVVYIPFKKYEAKLCEFVALCFCP